MSSIKVRIPFLDTVVEHSYTNVLMNGDAVHHVNVFHLDPVYTEENETHFERYGGTVSYGRGRLSKEKWLE